MCEPGNSTHCQERNFFVLFVAGNALGVRVQRGFAINEKLVMMMSMIERDLNEPSAVRLLFHGIRGGVPIVKIADEGDAVGGGRDTDEVDGFGHLFGRVTGQVMIGVHLDYNIFCVSRTTRELASKPVRCPA